MLIHENLKIVRQRIAEACKHCDRDPEQIQIVAVTKTVDVSKIHEAIDAGISIIGENRVQEAWQKFQTLDRDVSWHMVGHLQTNKVKRVLQFASLIQSVDSLHLAKEIQKQAEKKSQVIDILVQVNTSGEETKFGFSPETTQTAVAEIAKYENLRIKGLMTIGAFLPDPEDVRPCFKMLCRLRDQIKQDMPENVEMDILSMGMTGDYPIAIEEGATMVRIGTGIFGERSDG